MLENEFLKFNFKLFYKKVKLASNDKCITNEYINVDKTINCNFLDCIINKTRKKYKEINNLYIQKEIFELRYKLIEEMPNCNISKAQLDTLKYFKRNKPFTVLDADKNVGTVIISAELADKLA